MAYLKLIDRRSGLTLEFELEEVRIGRAPDCEIVPRGEGAGGVSGYHVRFVHKDGQWSIEDLGSRNGSFIDEIPVPGHVPRPVKVGQILRLGERGPRYKVEAVRKIEFEETVEEAPIVSRPSAPTMPFQAYGPTEKFDGSAMPEPPKPPKTTDPEAISPAQPIEATPDDQPPQPKPPREAAAHAVPLVDEPTERMEAAPPPAPPAPPAPQSPEPIPPSHAPQAEEPASIRIVVVETHSGERWEAQGGRIRVGRGKECELRPIGPSDTSVSRVHAEILLQPNGYVIIRDAQSRNGTMLNGVPVSGDQRLIAGDHIQLGDQGPNLSVDVLELPTPVLELRADHETEPHEAAPPPHEETAKKVDRALDKMGAPRRSFGGQGATVFFKQMFQETHEKSDRKIRIVVWLAVAVLVVAVGGIYWWTERRVQQTAAEFERRQQAAIAAIADSISQSAAAESERLRQEFRSALARSAPAAVVESLRVALGTAEQRTDALEAALRRAQNSMAEQLAAGDSIQQAARSELARLERELDRASSSGTPTALLDSLQQALRDAEQRSAQINIQLDAVRQVDLAAVAQANQGAIGLVTAFIGGGLYDGTGFVLTASGYMVTNRHVVSRDDLTADSVFVTMADRSEAQRGTVVMVASLGAPDLAVILIENYDGPFVPKVDWSGKNVRQGASAALIGFPAGLGNAMDRSFTLRTLMSAGIFSRVTAEVINFDGFTTGGSSGSPIFNAAGEVVAVHRAGLVEVTGLSFAVPITKLIPMMPAQVRRELGLQQD